MYRGTKWVDHAVDPVTGALVQQGTPQSAGNFNKIEHGITDGAVAQAISLIAAEQMGMDIKQAEAGIEQTKKDIAGKKTIRNARLTIGTSTSGWTLSDCDFLCDGTNDDDVFKEAFFSLRGFNAIGNDSATIVILGGAYHLKKPLEHGYGFPSVVHIQGEGNPSLYFEKALTETTTGDSRAPRAYPADFNADSLFPSGLADGISSIKGIRFIAGNGVNVGSFIYKERATTPLTIEDCIFYSYNVSAPVVFRSSDTDMSNSEYVGNIAKIHMNRCKFYNLGNYGFLIYPQVESPGTYERGSSGNGLTTEDANFASIIVVSECDFQGSTGISICSIATLGLVVENCRIEGVVCLYDYTTGCRFIGNQTTSVVILDTSGVNVISGNTIKGLTVTDGSYNLIIGNIISKPSGATIVMDGSSQNNLVHGNLLIGTTFTNNAGTTNTFTDNKVVAHP